MQGNSNQKPHSKLIRSLSLIAAIIVLIGSVLMYVWPGLDMRSKNASFVPFVSSAYAEEFAALSSIYGSVYAIALSMLWLYCCMCIVFCGGTLNVLIHTGQNRER